VPQLAHLRQKIRSVQKTKKITHAMRLISMSFYNKLEKRRPVLDAYVGRLESTFEYLLTHSKEWINPILAPDDLLDQKPLYIIVSTTKGWCGSLNTNLFRYIEQVLFLEENQAASFIIIGTKAISYFKMNALIKKYQNARLVAVYPEVASSNLFALADELIERALFGPQRYSTVSFFVNEARSFFAQKAVRKTVLPVSHNSKVRPFKDRQDAGTEDVLWEQPVQEILDFVAGRYLRGRIIQLLFNAMRAEHSARFLAMESATKNAEKIIDKLTRQFNKMRQAMITKEISELSAGAVQR
jgi:F-type H+-transporting ATPase subunit gamma